MNKIFTKCQNERLIFNDVIVLKIILYLLGEMNLEDGLKVSEGTNFLIKICTPIYFYLTLTLTLFTASAFDIKTKT